MKQKVVSRKEFIIFSEHGFFTGLAYGGIPQWSMDKSKAKPFDEECKLSAVQKTYYGDLLTEYI